jgi:hypothetical protein
MGDMMTNGTTAPKPTGIKARIEAAKAARLAQEAKLSTADREEIADREELAREEAAKLAAEEEARDLDLARRMDAAREKHGDAAKLAPVSIQGYADTFIVKLNGVAYKKWDKSINDSSNGKIDPQEERRKLIAASMEDWNGETDFGTTSLNGSKLLAYLDSHQGLVAPLIQEICILNGVVKKDRAKSG